MSSFVSGLILAAGGSTRLGQPKQLLPFRGRTLLGWVVSQVVSAASLDEVVVVLGGAAVEVRPRVEFGRARVVENPAFREGCASSYGAGIAALDPRSEAVAVLLGDQPGIEAAVIDRVVGIWRQGGKAVVVASYEERLGHPIVFGQEMFSRLVGLKGDKAAWKLLAAHPEWVRTLEVDRPLPVDVNTRQDYQSAVGAEPIPRHG